MLYGTDMLAAYCVAIERLVVSFRVLTDEGQERFFSPNTGTSGLVIGVELQTIRPLTAHHDVPAEASDPAD